MADKDSPGHPPESEDSPVHRRGFFTEGFRNLMRPFADIVEKKLQDLDTSAWEEPGAGADWSGYEGEDDYYDAYGGTAPSPPPEHLRPPGALPEEEFLSRCTSSNHCVQACPVSAIRLVWSGDPLLNGKPAVEPEIQACVLCPDLSCMKACPTGALQPVAREEIRMGTAAVRPEHCVRTTGEDCRICVDKCPVGPAAIDIPYEGAEVSVMPDACTGCGVCELACPVQPRAIVVKKAG